MNKRSFVEALEGVRDFATRIYKAGRDTYNRRIAARSFPSRLVHTRLTPGEKTDVIIYINSAGPNVCIENLMQTIYSLARNLGTPDYKFYIAVDRKEIAKATYDIFNQNPLLSGSLLEISCSDDSWANAFNSFYDRYIDCAKYFLICQDDIIMNTKDFFTQTVQKLADKKEKIGWITYTNDRYYDFDGIPLSNSVREGFSSDRDKKRVFECHNFPEEGKLSPETYHLLDYPKAPVKCHAPFSHIMMISSDALGVVGHAENWTKQIILIDEDWGMTALLKGYNNVWIPDIFYTHPNPYNSYKRLRDLKFAGIAHEGFEKKWGFNMPYTQETVELVRKKYANTNLPWSSYRKTYEWDYLK